MRRFPTGAALVMVTAGAFAVMLAAQDLPALPDGSDHGDPPFLVEGGWKPLLNGKNLDGWQLVDSTKKGQWVVTKAVVWGGTGNPTALMATPGTGDRIVNTGVDPKGNASNIYTTEKFGDVEVYVEFMVAAHSNSGFFLAGLYETQIWDSWGFVPRLDTDRCGAMYHYNGGPIDGIDGGIVPNVRADRPPGQWQSYHYWFEAPRFDAAGKKTAPAKFIRILHNGQSIHENVVRLGPTVASMKIPEAATNPIMLQGDHGAVAFRNIYVRPLRPLPNPPAPVLEPTPQAPAPVGGRGGRGANPAAAPAKQ